MNDRMKALLEYLKKSVKISNLDNAVGNMKKCLDKIDCLIELNDEDYVLADLYARLWNDIHKKKVETQLLRNRLEKEMLLEDLAECDAE